MKALLAHARLLLDVVSMKIFVWVPSHDGELLNSHLFFFDRYSDLADYHRQQGRIAKADRLAAIAEAYFQVASEEFVDVDCQGAHLTSVPIVLPPTRDGVGGDADEPVIRPRVRSRTRPPTVGRCDRYPAL